MFTESRLLRYEQPTARDVQKNMPCREQLQSLQQGIEQSVNTLRFNDAPQDVTVNIDPKKPVIFHIAGFDTVLRTDDTSATVRDVYRITRDVNDPSRIRIQVRPNDTQHSTNNNITTKENETRDNLAEFIDLQQKLKEIDQQKEPKTDIVQAQIEQRADGTRTLRLPEQWNRVELRVQGYTNPMILKPNSISLGDLKTNGFHIEKDPKNPNAFVIQGSLGIEAIAS